ncbi:unnamed protein product [Owenia fusiformis]|uniref:Uncharacterized protein n=1 Tax=Owenia fusiformis TaxID=6347 RepID=A0A8J1TSU8_OWEFU|nr:unnamed protein product [Owenia fusiformis]
MIWITIGLLGSCLISVNSKSIDIDTYGLKHTNPCTPDSIFNHDYYHPYPGNNSLYIQCNRWGGPYIRWCGPMKIWAPQAKTCVYGNPDVVNDEDYDSFQTTTGTDDDDDDENTGSNTINGYPGGGIQNRGTGDQDAKPIPGLDNYLPGRNTNGEDVTTPHAGEPQTKPSVDGVNPCVETGELYHPYPADPTKFIQCAQWGDIFIITCAPNQVWDQTLMTCKPDGTSNNKTPDGTNDKSPATKNGNFETPCSTTGENYYPHPFDESKFILCSPWGDSYIIWCGENKIWNQLAEACTIPGQSAPRVNNKQPQPEIDPETASPATIFPVEPQAGDNSGGRDIFDLTGICNNGNLYQSYPYDPSKFILCSHWGDLYLVWCGDNAHWNQNAQSCMKNVLIDHGGLPPDMIYNGNSGVYVNQNGGKQTQNLPAPMNKDKTTGQENPKSPSNQPDVTDNDHDDTKHDKNYQPPTAGPTEPKPKAWVQGMTLSNPCWTSNGLYHAYPDDKSKFIQCAEWGDMFVMQCPVGELWNQGIRTCTRNVNHGGDYRPGDATAEQTTQSYQTTRTFQTYPNTQYTTQELTQRPFPTTTPYTTTPSTPPSDPYTTSGNTESSNPCVLTGQQYQPHPYDSDKFILCAQWGDIFVVQCQDDKVYDSVSNSCVSLSGDGGGPEMGEDTRSTMNGYPGGPMTSEASYNPCSTGGASYQAYPYDMTKFIHCSKWGDAYLVECGSHKLWNDWYQACTGTEGDDTQDPNPGLDPDPEAPYDPSNPCTTPGEVYRPHPTDANKFIMCSGHTMYTMSCPAGLLWDNIKKTCNWQN